MRFEVNTELLNGISLEEFLLLWASSIRGTPATHIYTSLGTKGLGEPLFDLNGEKIASFAINTKGKEFVNQVLTESQIHDNRDDLKELAKSLKEIYPKGRKEGSSLPWADGIALIEKRLKLFFKKYGEFSHEAIISATKDYVEGFNGDYRFMRTLRYFIWKEERGAGGDIESTSDLLTYLEDTNREIVRNDWTGELR